jgi:FtsZ-interacting cell division protein YlmF
MARGRFNKILELIGLVDDEPEATSYDPQKVDAQVYNPPQRRAPEGARPVRQQGYSSAYAGGYAPGASAQRGYERGYDRYSAAPRPGDSPRAAYGAADRSADYRAGGYDAGSARPEARYSSRPEYARAGQGYRADTRSAAPAYRADPIRDEFERIEQPRANVVAMRPDPRPQTVIYYLRTLEECRDVITDLIDNKTVLLNLEEMDESTIQRGIDTLCGAAFALGATLRKASDKTYLIAPNNVDVAMTNDGERRY